MASYELNGSSGLGIPGSMRYKISLLAPAEDVTRHLTAFDPTNLYAAIARATARDDRRESFPAVHGALQYTTVLAVKARELPDANGEQGDIDKKIAALDHVSAKLRDHIREERAVPLEGLAKAHHDRRVAIYQGHLGLEY